MIAKLPNELEFLRRRVAELEAQLGVNTSERKQLKAQRDALEQDLTELMESTGVGLHWVAADGTIIWANEAQLKLLGFSREEYIGHNIGEFHADERGLKDLLLRVGNNEG